MTSSLAPAFRSECDLCDEVAFSPGPLAWLKLVVCCSAVEWGRGRHANSSAARVAVDAGVTSVSSTPPATVLVSVDRLPVCSWTLDMSWGKGAAWCNSSLSPLLRLEELLTAANLHCLFTPEPRAQPRSSTVILIRGCRRAGSCFGSSAQAPRSHCFARCTASPSGGTVALGALQSSPPPDALPRSLGPNTMPLTTPPPNNLRCSAPVNMDSSAAQHSIAAVVHLTRLLGGATLACRAAQHTAAARDKERKSRQPCL